jgi:hypothetical protein
MVFAGKDPACNGYCAMNEEIPKEDCSVVHLESDRKVVCRSLSTEELELVWTATMDDHRFRSIVTAPS